MQYSDWETHDTSKYLAFDCHTEGYALIFSNGTATEAHWVREGDQDDGVIRYYDIGLENEIVLNQGKTMVCLVQDFINDIPNQMKFAVRKEKLMKIQSICKEED